ncbi:MAG TPA: flagellar motor protein MotB [Nocardioidaceae bacterium]|nr:flagellar motor protein MotB [Nocardioidaceae bacterium]
MSGGAGGARRKRELPHEEHENHERWLVTYADMITLLMVLFIVLFAMSQVDQKKFNALKDGLAAGFGQSSDLLDGSQSLLDQPGTAQVGDFEPETDTTPEEEAAIRAAISKHDILREQRRHGEAESELRRLVKVLDRLMAALKAHGLEDDVRASIDERGLVISLVSKHVTFEPNLATLSARGKSVLDILAPVLRDLEDPIQLDGHTNQVKVKPKYYPTDWELSTARAVTVLRYLNERGGVPGARLSAAGYGHERPLIDPRLPDSQRINKRVDVVILTALPDETRDLLAQAAAARYPAGPGAGEEQG